MLEARTGSRFSTSSFTLTAAGRHSQGTSSTRYTRDEQDNNTYGETYTNEGTPTTASDKRSYESTTVLSIQIPWWSETATTSTARGTTVAIAGELNTLTSTFHQTRAMNSEPLIAGKPLDVLEEAKIRENGGIQKEGGVLANKRHQMTEPKYRKHGGV